MKVFVLTFAAMLTLSGSEAMSACSSPNGCLLELKTDLQKNPKLAKVEIDDLVEQARQQCRGTLTECQKAIQQIKDGKPVAAAASSVSKPATTARTTVKVLSVSPASLARFAAIKNSQGGGSPATSGRQPGR
jgi:hypothetical protein